METNKKTTTIKLGTKIISRTGKLLGTVTSHNRGGFVVTRESLSTQTITNKRIFSAFDRLVNGETLAYQRNPGQGGISYTVLVERAVIAALGGWVVETPTGYQFNNLDDD